MSENDDFFSESFFLQNVSIDTYIENSTTQPKFFCQKVNFFGLNVKKWKKRWLFKSKFSCTQNVPMGTKNAVLSKPPEKFDKRLKTVRSLTKNAEKQYTFNAKIPQLF